MSIKLLSTAVLLCYLVAGKVPLIEGQQVGVEVHTPVPIEPLNVETPTPPYVVHAMTTPTLKDVMDTTTEIVSTTTTNLDDVTTNMPTNVDVPQTQEGNWLTRLFGRNFVANSVGPSLVVEVDDATNDASLRIMNLPLVRRSKQVQPVQNATVATVPTSEVPTTLSTILSLNAMPIDLMGAAVDTTGKDVRKRSAAYESLYDRHRHHRERLTAAATVPRSRQVREVDFKIHDLTVIQALIDALKVVDPERAALLQANIYRVQVQVEIEDDDDDFLDNMRYMWRQLPLSLGRKRRSVSTKEPLDPEVQEQEIVEPEVLEQEAAEVEEQEVAEVEPLEPEVAEGGIKRKRAAVQEQKKNKKDQEVQEPEEGQVKKPKKKTKNTKEVEAEPMEEAAEVEPQEQEAKKSKKSKSANLIVERAVKGKKGKEAEVEPAEVESVEVEPTEAAEIEPTEAVEVEPTEAAEVEPQEKEVKKSKKSKIVKRAVKEEKSKGKKAKEVDVEAAEAAEVEPTEAVEIEPTEAVEVEPTEATEVEPKEPKKSKKSKSAKLIVKRAVKGKKAKEAEVEPAEVEPVEVEPTEAVEVEPTEAVEIEPTEAVEVEAAEVEPQEPKKSKKSKKQKRAVSPNNVATSTTNPRSRTQSPLTTTLPPTRLGPITCDDICRELELKPVCATNGYCMHQFPSKCSLDKYSCKHQHARFNMINEGVCRNAEMPRCTDLLQ